MINIKPKVLISVAAVFVVVMVAIWVNGQPPVFAPVASIPTPQPSAQPPAGTPPAPARHPAAPPTTAPTASNTTPPAQTAIAITSPTSGTIWVFGKGGSIKWNRGAGVKGGVSLLRASDRSVVGWINSETGIEQKAYDWDARGVFLTRYNSQSKDISPGDYVIKIHFDSAYIPDITSAPFSIVNASEVQIPAHNITIQNYAFSPANMTVKKGDKLIVTNNDSVTHSFLMPGLPRTEIAPSTSISIETSALFTSTYNYYCDIHPSMTGKLTVQ